MFFRQIILDGAGLGGNGVLRVIGVLQRGELVLVGLQAHKGLAAHVVDVGEVHDALTLRVGRQARHAQIRMLGLQLGEHAVEVHGVHHQLQAQVIRNILGQGDVKARQLGIAALVDGIELIGGEVRAGGDGELPALHSGDGGLQLVVSHGGVIRSLLRAGALTVGGVIRSVVAAAAGRDGQRHGQRQNQCKKLLHGIAISLFHAPAVAGRFSLNFQGRKHLPPEHALPYHVPSLLSIDFRAKMNIYLPLLVECSILSGSIPEKQPKICEYFQHRCILQMNKRVNI